MPATRSPLSTSPTVTLSESDCERRRCMCRVCTCTRRACAINGTLEERLADAEKGEEMCGVIHTGEARRRIIERDTHCRSANLGRFNATSSASRNWSAARTDHKQQIDHNSDHIPDERA
jgi:hypothetical protein